jgi:hypothetical protein
MWALAYAFVAQAFGLWLRRGDRGVTVYATRGLGARSVVYGISDIDLAVIAAGDARHPGRARQRVERRYESLRRLLPWLCNSILDVPMVLERDELVQASGAPMAMYGFIGNSGLSEPAAVYFGARAHRHRIRLHERAGLLGPTTGWQRLSGPDVSLPQPRRDRSQLRVAAWLELQWWWRFFFEACGQPPSANLPFLCVKIVAEPARIWLALARGEYPSSRREVLERVLSVLPEEEVGVSRALWLEAALPHEPAPPVAEFLRYLVRFSCRIAAVLIDEVAASGTSAVRLDWDPHDELALDANAGSRLEDLGGDRQSLQILPLVDWRALTRAATRWSGGILSEPPDESIAAVSLDPCECSELMSAARAGNKGPYPALRTGDLLVLAGARWPRTQLRAVHCPLTDPVSFALMADRSSAQYPRVSGWSAVDTARRAVCEHRAWLAHPDVLSENGEAVSMLISAARAALFEESIVEGSPELPLTAAATLRRMRARNPDLACTFDEVEASYFAWRRDGTVPGGALIVAAREAVCRMRSYADA